jgi:pimeloyl-ACP methyl ester carboxylesterase
MPLFFYHCRDDETVPFDHLALYKKAVPQAAVREIDAGGHQLNNDLALVAEDIKTLR